MVNDGQLWTTRRKTSAKKVDDVADLKALMLSRGQKRSENLFASLGQKYGGKAKGKNK